MTTADERLTIHAYLMGVALMVAARSTCPRKRVGAVLARGGRILSTGYNGAPAGAATCAEAGCLPGEGGRCVRAIHAEVNALTRAREGGDTLYVTHYPCVACLQAAYSHAADLRVVYLYSRHDLETAVFAAAAPLGQLSRLPEGDVADLVAGLRDLLTPDLLSLPGVPS